ncbi:hypothetical protein JA9_004298 [Meyerozyma sp. JA9]|nr:hypothetical protein JA9_004298 [Meyerozyma sp. JA9]
MYWGKTKSAESRLADICKSTPIVDTHNDFPYLLRLQLHNEFQSEPKFTFTSALKSNTDLPRLKKGRIGVQFFSCFIECKFSDHLYQDFNKPNSAVRDTMEQIDVTKRLTQAYPSDLALVHSADEAIKQYKSGKIAIALGVEGLHQVDSSLAVLRMYHELGVRYITLTHNCDNPFATAASSVVGGLPDKGLTPFGKDCILEMNRLGIMVDLSHVSLQTMYDALETTKAPVIFSHSSAFALTNNERNVRDEVLLKVKENGGVVCVNFFPEFIVKEGHSVDDVSIDDAADHLMHIVNLIGWDHVGFGSDFDGIPCGPRGLEDVSKYPDLVYKLMDRSKATDDDIAKAMGGNVMRVWREAEKVSQQSKGVAPVETNWEKREWRFFQYLTELPELFPGAYDAKHNVYDDSQSLVLTKEEKS